MKKMNKLFCPIILMAVIISACGNIADAKEMHLVADAKTDSFETEKDLDNYSGLILRVCKTETEENYIESLGKPNQYHGWTLSEVEIISVLKNKLNTFLKEGDTITVLENQFSFFDTEKKSNITVHVNRYVMMKPGNEYILYADYSENDGWYVIAGGIFGKVNINADEPLIYNSREDSAFNERMSSLREEVLNKIGN